MTDRPPVSGEPSTEAGRRLLEDLNISGIHTPAVKQRILAIEAEARKIGDVERVLLFEAGVADAEARATPPSLDVSALSLAFDWHSGPARASDNIAHDRGHHGGECWEQIAAEYVRLTSKEERE